jgi:hypothetical protein
MRATIYSLLVIILCLSCREEEPLPVHPMEGEWRSESYGNTTVISIRFGLKTVYEVMCPIQATHVNYNITPQAPIGSTLPIYTMNVNESSFDSNEIKFHISLKGDINFLEGNNVYFRGQQVHTDTLKGWFYTDHFVQVNGAWYSTTQLIEQPIEIVRIKE